MMKRLLCIIGMLGFAMLTLATDSVPEKTHFRLGPVFEWKSTEGHLSQFALRPFFSWAESEHDRRDSDMEVVWPLSHFGWRGDEYHWRVLMTFWQERDLTDPNSDYSLAIPPLWVNGRDEGEHYWGLFPIYGHVPKMFLIEDMTWALFPGYLSYRTGGSRGIRRRYLFWPLFSLKDDEDTTRWALWPLYGTKHEPAYDSRFICWPIWTETTFHEPNHNGYAWMLFPLFEKITADTENGWGIFPPLFFKDTTASDAFLLRCPWPLFERYTDPKESTWKSWRFWGMTHRGTRDGWWFLHPIMVKQLQRTENLHTESFRFWPFYTNEKNYGINHKGEAVLQNSYFRIWPFYASAYTEHEGLKRKSLILFPIRDVPAIERNWSPFWTFYTARQAPDSDEVLHELFWGLIWWHTKPGNYREQNPLEAEE